MASDTKNVKLGVCRVLFNGTDLGYTKGGVEVEVKTDTHEVNVDQFGKTPINEYIMGRSCTVKAPLAETTLDNLVATMPGATLVSDGVVATGTITITTQPTTGQTITVNGQTVTFKTAAAGPLEVTIGANASATASNLTNVLNASSVPAIAAANYSVLAAVVTVNYDLRGTVGNAFTLATGTAAAAVTMSGATLTGGTDATTNRVDVTSGIGIDLLSIAKELRLHPVAKADNDKSEDFVIPLCASSGALSFAYKLEDERVFNAEFKAYPDPTTNKLFYFGQ